MAFTSVLTKPELGQSFNSAVSYAFKTVRIRGPGLQHKLGASRICSLFREATVGAEREAGLLLAGITGIYPVTQKTE